MFYQSEENRSIWSEGSREGRAAILDSNPFTRSVYGALLEQATGLAVFSYSSLEELCRQFDFSFHFLILDWEATDELSRLVKRFRAASPRLLLGAISDHWDQGSVSEALGLGFSGFFDRHLSTKDLAHQLYLWKEYHACLSPNLLKEVFSLAKGGLPLYSEERYPQLTRREQEVKAYAAGGLTNQQIADRLSISKSTVDNHFINIYRKLGIKNRRQLIRLELGQEMPDLIPYTLPGFSRTYQKEVFFMNQELSEIYAFFANIFMEPIPVPGEAFVRELAGRVRRLLESESDLPEKVKEDFAAFGEACRAKDFSQVQEELAVDRTMLFRGTRKEKGPLPPYESFYGGGRGKSNTLAALTEFYRECGMKLSSQVHERADYAGVILACLSELYRRDGDDTSECCLAFFREHVQNWIPAFCDEMASYAETPFFRGIAVLLKSVILSFEISDDSGGCRKEETYAE